MEWIMIIYVLLQPFESFLKRGVVGGLNQSKFESSTSQNKFPKPTDNIGIYSFLLQGMIREALEKMT